MPKQTTQELAALLGETLADKPKRKARVLDLDAPEESEAGVTRVTPVTPPTRVSQEAAPKRDFHRVANSIAREAVPAGLFTGKGKQLYDYLYLQTRGAVVPVRSVRIPRGVVMRGAKMTRPTYRTQLARLIAVGLVKVEEMGGDHLGNLYTVYLPEEVANPGYPGMHGNPAKKLDGQPGQETDPGNPGLSADFQRTSDKPQTLIPDLKQTDDEAAPLARALTQAERELTGKNGATASQWEDLASVLVTELKIAAARAESVSSVPAFLAEHLRRRLFKKDKAKLDSEEKASPAPRGPQIDASQCPDCKGVGMWYPEGFDKGVAKCQHSKLGEGKG